MIIIEVGSDGTAPAFDPAQTPTPLYDLKGFMMNYCADGAPIIDPTFGLTQLTDFIEYYRGDSDGTAPASDPTQTSTHLAHFIGDLQSEITAISNTQSISFENVIDPV